MWDIIQDVSTSYSHRAMQKRFMALLGDVERERKREGERDILVGLSDSVTMCIQQRRQRPNRRRTCQGFGSRVAERRRISGKR